MHFRYGPSGSGRPGRDSVECCGAAGGETITTATRTRNSSESSPGLSDRLDVIATGALSRLGLARFGGPTDAAGKSVIWS